MTSVKTIHPEAVTDAASPDRVSADELNNHARQLGIETDAIKIRDIDQPDFVTVTIGKPGGRSIRRVVPRECWEEPAYRSSLIRDMGLLLA